MIVDDFQDEIITDVTAAADNTTASSASVSIDEEEEYCNNISPNNNNSRSQQQQRRLRTLDSFLEQAFQVTKNNKNIHNSTTARSNSFYSSLEEQQDQQDQQDQQPTRSSSSSYDAIDTNTNPHHHATKESSRSTATATRFDESSLAITIPVIPNNQPVGESTSSIIINAIKNDIVYKTMWEDKLKELMKRKDIYE